MVADVFYHENSSMNLTEDASEKRSRLLQIPILISLAILAICGNAAVIWQLCRKRLRSRCFSNINFLILQLAVSDTMVACFCFMGDGLWKATYEWVAGDYMCKFFKYMQMFSLFVSTYIIVTIGLDRCIAIRCALTRYDHKRVVKILSGFAWGFAAIISLPQVYLFRTEWAPYSIEKGQFEQCVTHGAYTEAWQEPAYVVFTFCAMFAIPLLLITASYTLIFAKIRHESGPQSGIVVSVNSSRAGSFNSASAEKRDALMKKAKTKALCVSILVIVTFLICWAPYYFSAVHYVIVNQTSPDGSTGTDSQIFQIVFFFGMSNSVLNPIVYGAFHMARRSQSAWRKWNRRFPASLTGVLPGGEPDSYSFVFSPLAKGQPNYSVNSSRSTLPHAASGSFRIARTPSARYVTHAVAGKTTSLDV